MNEIKKGQITTIKKNPFRGIYFDRNHCFFNDASLLDKWYDLRKECEERGEEEYKGIFSCSNFTFFCDYFVNKYNIDFKEINCNHIFSINEFDELSKKYRYFWNNFSGLVIPTREINCGEKNGFTKEFFTYFNHKYDFVKLIKYKQAYLKIK